MNMGTEGVQGVLLNICLAPQIQIYQPSTNNKLEMNKMEHVHKHICEITVSRTREHKTLLKSNIKKPHSLPS